MIISLSGNRQWVRMLLMALGSKMAGESNDSLHRHGLTVILT